jgi:hypothetical protein
MAQKKYTESGDASLITSKINYDFLDTIVRLNIEREIQAETNLDSRLRLFLKVRKSKQTKMSLHDMGKLMNARDIQFPHVIHP